MIVLLKAEMKSIRNRQGNTVLSLSREITFRKKKIQTILDKLPAELGSKRTIAPTAPNPTQYLVTDRHSRWGNCFCSSLFPCLSLPFCLCLSLSVPHIIESLLVILFLPQVHQLTWWVTSWWVTHDVTQIPLSNVP